ncbi:response regulator [Eubacteriales bacterium OttesenSCG-928-K08]|nr:response regulator [Eubacteriales bacterium OttesenSCG-928-K08]
MKNVRKHRSLRLTVLGAVSFVLLLFVAVFFIVFSSSISSMLLNVEQGFLEEQRDTVLKQIKAAQQSVKNHAMDNALWEETLLFAEGENPDYFPKNWPDTHPLQNYDFNFMIFKDAAGNDLHVEFRDFINDTPMQAPEGFSQHITTMANTAISEYNSLRYRGVDYELLLARLGEGGIFFYEEVPYYFYSVPITLIDSADEPVGTLTFGNILDDAFFKWITHLDAVEFELRDIPVFVSPRESTFEAVDNETISMLIPLADYFGSAKLLSMSRGRTVYAQGQYMMRITSFLLVLVVLVFITALYFIIVKRMIYPVEKISHDISNIIDNGALDKHKYSSSSEFIALATSINDMLEQHNQSNISVDAFKRIFDGIDAHLYVSDIETNEILFINHKMARDFQVVGDATGRTCYEVFRSEDGIRCRQCPIEQLLENPGQSITWESHNAVTGQYYSNTDYLIEWTDKKLVHLQNAIDITETKKAEAALTKRLEQQELMSAISQSFISPADMHTLVGNALRLTGEFVGAGKLLMARYDEQTGLLPIVDGWYNEAQGLYPEPPGNPLVESQKLYEDLVIKGESVHIVNNTMDLSDPERKKLQELGVFAYLCSPLYSGGKFWGALCFNDCTAPRVWSNSDIHLARLIGNVISGVIDRNITEEELFRMSSIVNSSPEFIALALPGGKFDYVNKGVVDITGYLSDELLEGGFALLLDKESLEDIRREYLPTVLETGKCFFECGIRRKDGDKRIMAFSMFLVDESAERFGVIASDLTEIRQLEQALIYAKDQAESSNRAKSDFLSRMSHEMRTPMNAIIGMTTIAQKSNDPERKEYCLDKISDASTHLLGVINDILDMSKIEANKFELNPEEFEFDKMLAQAVTVIHFRVDEKKQNLFVNVDERLPKMLVGDDQRLAQVITNLLSNAVKFTPEGGDITLAVELINETDDGICTLEFSVKDTGIGISQEQQSRLFRSFEQADGGIARRFGGTGLGLAISKSIVNLMGGDIRVASQEGVGSSFIFTAECKRANKNGKKAPEAEPAARQISENCFMNKRILVAEDIEINQEIVAALLEETGVTIDFALNGIKAVELFSVSPEAYGMIFMDIHMPEMDGFEATRRIRALNIAQAKTVPIVAMTANVFREDIEKCLAAGMDGHVGKPIVPEEMFEKMNEYLLR